MEPFFVLRMSNSHNFVYSNSFIQELLPGRTLPIFKDENDFVNRVQAPIIDILWKQQEIVYFNAPHMGVPNRLTEINDIEKVAIVNAWDPHSIVGNGNNMDRSLDGFWGRSTNLGIRCWSGTNNMITKEGVPHNYIKEREKIIDCLIQS